MRRLLAPIPIAVLAVVVALVALLAYGLASNEPDRGVEQALVAGGREPAPEFELPRLSGGGTASLADYRGKVVVLNFWASWCGPCKVESPLLQRWHERLVDTPVRLVLNQPVGEQRDEREQNAEDGDRDGGEDSPHERSEP